jgi:hypothetical protein
VTDKDGGAFDSTQRAKYSSYVPLEGVEAVLSRDDLVPVRLKRGDQFAKA